MKDAVQLNQNKPVGGTFGRDFCSSRHPTIGEVWCRRLKGHTGDCAAFIFSIKTPETWPNPREVPHD